MQTREKLILATVLVRTATAALELKAMPDARRRRLAARKALHARQAAALQKAIIGAVSPVFRGMLTEVADRLAAIDATKEAMTSWRNPFKGFDPSQPRDEAGRWTQTGAGPQPEPTAEEAKARKELTNHLEMVAGFMKPPEGFKYASTEQLVLENGQFDTPAPVPSGVPKGQQKLCFMNAFQLATSHPDKYTYVEGYAHPGFMPLPIHHAWVVDNQGKVIDNTWETPGDAYFGVHMPLKFIMQRADKTGVYGVFGGYGDSRDLYKDGLPQSAKKSVKVFCPTGPGGGIDPTCKPGQTASGFTVGGTVQIAGRDVSLEYDETLTSPDTIRLAAKWINGVPPRALQDSTVRRICIYDNAEDVTRKLEELGISPDEGMANGAYDFATGTVYAAVWDGYEDSPRTLFHELGHSVVGYDEDAAENWARIYMPGMGEWQGGKSTEPCRIPAGNPGGGQFAPCTGEGGLPLLAHVEITRGAHHFGGVSNKIFGRIVTEEEVAAVAGAIDDAEVEINVTQSRIYVDIKHPKYEASRIIGMAGVHNSSFEVKGKRGGGVGTTVFASQVKHAAAMGLESISTEAVGSSGDPDYNGYYTWARLGYDARLDTTSVSMGRLRANFPDAEKISDLMKTPEGRTYWKENGGGFSGIFDLREGSQSRKVLDAYVAAKTKGTPGTKSTEPCRVPAGSSEGGQFSACNSGDFGDIELTSFGKTDSQPGPKMDNAEFEYLVSRRLGRPVTAEQIARAAGAMPGAKVKISAGYDEVKVTINHKDYDCIREFNIKDKWIENAYFAAQETGKGIGTDVFASQVKAAAELGFKDIVTTATGEYGDEDYNGYYTWPRLGYDTEIYNLPQKRSINREFPEAKSLSDLMKTPEGRSWWKQNGTTFRAVFDLNEGSQSRKVLDAYVAAKQARATAGAKSGGRSDFGSSVGRFGQKSAADNARALTAQILDAKKWTTRLVDAIFPVLARGMGEAAWAELLQTGAEIPATKATTATEWLQQHGLTAPPGVLTEWPPWLIKAIEEELSNAFSEDYWEEIVDVTTRDDIETVIADGLQNGSSIRDLSDAIRETLGGDYYHGRSKNIAITEAGNALNGGRMRGIQALAEELGPEVPLRAVWLSILSNTTRDTHANLDGVPANEDGFWWLGGMWVPWPGFYGLPPGERCNCYCTVVSEFGLDDVSASQLIAEYQQRIADYETGTGEFAEGKAFCPTGPGGGIDNSCGRGQRRDNVLVSNLSEAADVHVQNLKIMLEFLKTSDPAKYRRWQEDNIDFEEIRGNWTKQYRKRTLWDGDKAAFVGLDKTRQRVFEEAIAHNRENELLQRIVKNGPPMTVLHTRPEKGNGANGEYVGGVIRMYDQWNDDAYSDKLDVGGAVIGGGAAGTIRHEYGHALHDTKVTREQWAEWTTRFQQNTEAIKTEVSKYAATNPQEFFAETFTMATHPKYDREKVGDFARASADLVIKWALQ